MDAGRKDRKMMIYDDTTSTTSIAAGMKLPMSVGDRLYQVTVA